MLQRAGVSNAHVSMFLKSFKMSDGALSLLFVCPLPNDLEACLQEVAGPFSCSSASVFWSR